MAYKVVLSSTAEDDFAKLDKSIQQRIFKYLKKIEEREDPRTLGEQLQENLSAYWKFRVGDYRLVAEIKDDILIFLMLAVGPRRDIYKKAAKRLV